MSEDQVFYYLCFCHDQGFIPDFDSLSDKFPETNWDVLRNELESFVNLHEMDGIKIGGVINALV